MKKYKGGYTTGVYDMFHIGHLNILKRVNEQCDFLVVGVSDDELVQYEKYKTPVIPYIERVAIVAVIKYVDQVVPQVNKNNLCTWIKYHFDKIFVGSDWEGSPQWKKYEEQFRGTEAEIVYLPYTKGIPNTQLTGVIKWFLDQFTEKPEGKVIMLLIPSFTVSCILIAA